MNDLPRQPDCLSPDGGPSEQLMHLAYGEAAIILIECLMLTLVERGVLTPRHIGETVDAALSTKRQMVADREHARIAAVAVGVLTNLANSLAASKAR
jgi:hypothetical protein